MTCLVDAGAEGRVQTLAGAREILYVIKCNHHVLADERMVLH